MLFGKTFSNCQHIYGADARCQQTLMGIAESCICILYFLLLLQPLAESIRPQLCQQVLGTLRVGGIVVEGRNDGRFQALAGICEFDIGVAIDDDITQKANSLGTPVELTR